MEITERGRTRSSSPERIGQKLDIAERGFKIIVAADDHLDGKAAHILAAMAFITAAASGIFARAYAVSSTAIEVGRSGNTANAIVLSNHITITISFWIFIVSVLIGSLFHLAALGPGLNIPAWFRGVEADVKSLIFFEFVAQTSKEKWELYWKEKTTDELENQMAVHFIVEARLIAQKARNNTALMLLGGSSFDYPFLR